MYMCVLRYSVTLNLIFLSFRWRVKKLGIRTDIENKEERSLARRLPRLGVRKTFNGFVQHKYRTVNCTMR